MQTDTYIWLHGSEIIGIREAAGEVHVRITTSDLVEGEVPSLTLTGTREALSRVLGIAMDRLGASQSDGLP